MTCAYCQQKRQQLSTAVKTGDVKTAVKTAAEGAGAILGLVNKTAGPTKTVGHVAGKTAGKG